MYDKTAKMPDGIPTMRAIAMPADTNANGDIFGGWLLSLMDLAAGSVAGRRSRGRAATVAIEAMAFLAPVKVGDEVSVFSHIARVGHTSIRVEVEAWRRARESDETYKVTQGVFTFVAIDEDGKPRQMPPEETPAAGPAT